MLILPHLFLFPAGVLLGVWGFPTIPHHVLPSYLLWPDIICDYRPEDHLGHVLDRQRLRMRRRCRPFYSRVEHTSATDCYTTDTMCLGLSVVFCGWLPMRAWSRKLVLRPADLRLWSSRWNIILLQSSDQVMDAMAYRASWWLLRASDRC